ncbi:6-pyruvoyl trahydropterin synthase family protein [Natronoarchaeum rubrum]|uniref:6-pyruvoyl trahydropterin synthase family protein n=1 Tax=Natronoarchaeum rubrum TaxID=755311 RepID=UPI00211381AA|nr:6-pyruvoyl tetrahydropterin synthase family protein [Natronoarchaeum rubrum]
MTKAGTVGRDDAAADAETAATDERVLYVGRDRPIRISAGHRLMHHDGKCSRPHGHNYEIAVRVTGELTEEGWVVDKGDITSVISDWDHMFLLETEDPLVEAFESSGDGDAVVELERPPTAEVMAAVLEERLADALPDTVSDVAVQVSETAELCGGSPI